MLINTQSPSGYDQRFVYPVLLQNSMNSFNMYSGEYSVIGHTHCAVVIGRGKYDPDRYTPVAAAAS